MKVKWGILGVAKIARKLVPAIQESDFGEVSAIASRDINKAKKFASEYGIANSYGNYEDLLDDKEISAVYNPLPNHLHKHWTIESAKHNKHVLCEKPFALNALEAKQMFASCDENNIKVMEAFMYRFNPIITRIKNLVNSETIGELRYIDFNFSHTLESELIETDNYRLNKAEGGGAFYDLGVYGVNLCNYLTDSYPQEILNSTSIDYNDDKADKTSLALIKYQNNVICNIASSFRFFGNHLQISGTKGVIEVSNIISQEKGNLILKKFRSKEIQSETFPRFNSYIAQINHFNDCILNNKEPIITSEDTIETLKTIEKLIKKITWI